jgi:hypothetical protein
MPNISKKVKLNQNYNKSLNIFIKSGRFKIKCFKKNFLEKIAKQLFT